MKVDPDVDAVLLEALHVEFQVPREKVHLDVQLEDLAFDSLDIAELSIVLEELEDVVFEDADLEKWKTVGDVQECLNRRRRPDET